MAHLCINCNAPDVRRNGDTFTCGKCGYQWDVAHEQANAAFLASQGRQPAEPGEPAVEKAGLPAGESARSVEAPVKVELETPAGSPGDEQTAGGGKDYLEWLAAMTKAELVALAAEHGIELSDELRKADIVNTIAAVLPSASDDTHGEDAS